MVGLLPSVPKSNNLWQQRQTNEPAYQSAREKLGCVNARDKDGNIDGNQCAHQGTRAIHGHGKSKYGQIVVPYLLYWRDI